MSHRLGDREERDPGLDLPAGERAAEVVRTAALDLGAGAGLRQTLPCDVRVDVEVSFFGAAGSFVATAKGPTLTLKGEPGPLEEFNGL